MGLVKLNIQAYLTQKGRESLIKGKGNGITSFTIFDSDINYNSEVETNAIVDISGDGGCVKSLAIGYEPKYFIWSGEKPQPNAKLLIDGNTVFVDNKYNKKGSSTEKLQIQLTDKLDYDCTFEIIIEEGNKYIENILYKNDIIIINRNELLLNNNKTKFNIIILKNNLISEEFFINYKSFGLLNSNTVTSNSNIYLTNVTDTSKELEQNNIPINYEIVLPDFINLTLIKKPADAESLNFNVGFFDLGTLTLANQQLIEEETIAIINDNKTLLIKNVVGGVPPYKYKLTNSSGTIIKDNVIIQIPLQENVGKFVNDEYTITLKDNVGTILTKTASYTQALSQIGFTVTKIRDNISGLPNNGIIQIKDINGGNGNYSCDIKNNLNVTIQTLLLDNINELFIYNLNNGVYNVIIRDTVGITTTKQVTLGVTQNYPNIIMNYDDTTNELTISNVVKINNDNATHSLTINGVVKQIPYFDGVYTYIQAKPILNTYRIIFNEYMTNRKSIRPGINDIYEE